MPRQVIKHASTVFITQVTWQRDPLLRDPANVELLLTRLRECKNKHPFAMRAWVVLPDHFHLLIHPGTSTQPGALMQCVKATFTIAYRLRKSLPKRTQVWQKGYWAHVINSPSDFNRHVDYIHLNPVHHGVSRGPDGWEWSSFQQWQRGGYYEDGWGSTPLEPWVLAMGAGLEG